MEKTSLARAIAGAFAFASCAAAAQGDAVVVTATPSASSLFELVPPADALHGQSLALRRKSTLGETLDGMPGIGATYFGPHASRPVIRGLDGDRIRLLQNGTGTLDASSFSFDHAVPYDPLVAERIEVVRGPAAVLYGGSAVGGVVNTIDNRIPTAPISGFSGKVEPRYGGADRERSLGALLEGGNGRLALHADVFDRRSRDLRTPAGRLANSSADADGGTLGGSLTWAGGHAGLSYGSFRSNYGSIPEPTVRVAMKSDRWDLAGEARELGTLITGAKFKLGNTDYEHRELEDGAVNTTFRNKGHDGRLELAHGGIGPLQGAIGFSFTGFDFSALGAEAFVPQTSTRANGLFIYEELPLGALKLSFGGRQERTKVRSEGDPGGTPRFGAADSRSFSATSTALGALYSFTKQWALAGNVSFTERAPAFYELYANGPHAATGVYEVGDATLAKEKSRSLDVALRWQSGPHTASFGVFCTRFSNFIALAGTGNTRGADGELNPVDADGDNVADVTGEEILPEFTYRMVPAVFRGFEAQGRLRVYERVSTLFLVLRGDYVKAEDRSTGQPLPRIAPLRLGAGLEYSLNRFSAGLDVQRVRAQNRVAPNELPTNAYTLVNASFAYRLGEAPVAAQAFVRVNNLFHKEARNHVSFLKDRAPLPGRGLLVGLRASF